MTAIQSWLNGKKTYLTGAAGILTALAGYGGGSVDASNASLAIFVAIQTMFLRGAIAQQSGARA